MDVVFSTHPVPLSKPLVRSWASRGKHRWHLTRVLTSEGVSGDGLYGDVGFGVGLFSFFFPQTLLFSSSDSCPLNEEFRRSSLPQAACPQRMLGD